MSVEQSVMQGGDELGGEGYQPFAEGHKQVDEVLLWLGARIRQDPQLWSSATEGVMHMIPDEAIG